MAVRQVIRLRTIISNKTRHLSNHTTLLSLTSDTTYSETIKKSKFVVHAGSATTFRDGLAYLEKVKDIKATHNCWAYNSVMTQRSSDDGEPSGTAGKPILNALVAENITNTMVVVTRYYGGTNLGTGGLVRAYGGTVRKALQNAKKVEYIPCTDVEIRVSNSDSGMVYSLLRGYSIISNNSLSESNLSAAENVSADIIDTAVASTNESEDDVLKGGGSWIALTVSVPDGEVDGLRRKFGTLLQGRGSFHFEPHSSIAVLQ